MKSSAKKNVLFAIVLIAAVGAAGYLGNSAHRLIQERDGLVLDLEKANRKFKMLQRKYAEQKTLVAATQRQKLAVEGQLLETQKALASLQAEKQTLLDQLSTGEKSYAKDVARLEHRVEKYKEQIDKLIENRDQYKAKLAETVAVVKERNEMIYSLRAEKDELTADFHETSSTLKRCEKHNGRLSTLAEELIVAYENKGVGDSMLQSEPFTKLKKVEVEQLIQKYRDRIDNDNLGLINPQK